jgi:hypothetical protein
MKLQKSSASGDCKIQDSSLYRQYQYDCIMMQNGSLPFTAFKVVQTELIASTLQVAARSLDLADSSRVKLSRALPAVNAAQELKHTGA